jgi:L-glyceraldehyde 3-phosphate reductase
MGAVAHAVKSGKALYAAVSSYSAEATREAHRLLKEMGVPLLIHQPNYNMFNRWIETEHLVEALAETGTGCIAFCPLAQGLLTNRYLAGIPEDSRAAKSHGFLKKDAITEARVKQIQGLNAIAQARGQSLAQMAIAWVLRLPVMTSALIGASKVSQIEENMKALDNLAFSKEETDSIEALLAG